MPHHWPHHGLCRLSGTASRPAASQLIRNLTAPIPSSWSTHSGGRKLPPTLTPPPARKAKQPLTYMVRERGWPPQSQSSLQMTPSPATHWPQGCGKPQWGQESSWGTQAGSGCSCHSEGQGSGRLVSYSPSLFHEVWGLQCMSSLGGLLWASSRHGVNFPEQVTRSGSYQFPKA